MTIVDVLLASGILEKEPVKKYGLKKYRLRQGNLTVVAEHIPTKGIVGVVNLYSMNTKG